MVCILKGRGDGLLPICSAALKFPAPLTLWPFPATLFPPNPPAWCASSSDLDHGIEGKDVLIVEDIVDSGMSTSYLLNS